MFCFPVKIAPVCQLFLQGVALTGRNRIVAPCSVGRRTGFEPGSAAADRPRALQTTTDDADRWQRAKQYWPIRRASDKQNVIAMLIVNSYSHADDVAQY